MATVKKIKKAQRGVTATKDSSAYFKNEQSKNYESAARNMSSPKYSEAAFKRAAQSGKDLDRQANKGKPGYDANGNPVKKKAAAGAKLKKAQDGVTEKKSLKDKIFGTKEERQDRRLDRQSNREDRQLSREENREDRILRRQCVGGKCGGKARGYIGYKDGGKVMMKRADGSTSQRGLWDNIRSAAKKNKAAGKPGKKPTSAMLKQEKKIKSQTKKK